MTQLRTTDKITAAILGGMSLLLAVALSVDLAGAYGDPAAYEEVYGTPFSIYARQSYAMIAAGREWAHLV